MVEVKKLRTSYDSCGAHATLCADRACRRALAVAPCDFLAREMAFGSCLAACAPAFAAAAPAGTSQLLSSTRNTLSQLGKS